MKCSCLKKDKKEDIEIILINGNAFIVCKNCGEEVNEIDLNEIEDLYWGC